MTLIRVLLSLRLIHLLIVICVDDQVNGAVYTPRISTLPPVVRNTKLVYLSVVRKQPAIAILLVIEQGSVLLGRFDRTALND